MDQAFTGTAKPYRHELKYVISEGEHEILARRLRSALTQDKYAKKNGGEYLIRSLYYDDPFDTAVEEKTSGIQVRDKFRIRIYNYSDASIKLERKHKDGPYISKSSLLLSRDECEALLHDGEAALSVEADESGARYAITGPSGEGIDSADDWQPLVSRLENDLPSAGDGLQIIWP